MRSGAPSREAVEVAGPVPSYVMMRHLNAPSALAGVN
jgi:hypothetical protein